MLPRRSIEFGGRPASALRSRALEARVTLGVRVPTTTGCTRVRGRITTLPPVSTSSASSRVSPERFADGDQVGHGAGLGLGGNDHVIEQRAPVHHGGGYGRGYGGDLHQLGVGQQSAGVR
jgi:hypothetical protein